MSPVVNFTHKLAQPAEGVEEIYHPHRLSFSETLSKEHFHDRPKLRSIWSWYIQAHNIQVHSYIPLESPSDPSTNGISPLRVVFVQGHSLYRITGNFEQNSEPGMVWNAQTTATDEQQKQEQKKKR